MKQFIALAFALLLLVSTGLALAPAVSGLSSSLVESLVGLSSYATSFFMMDVSAAAKTWDGGGADDNWDTALNWDLDTVPVTSDTVTFDTGDVVIVNVATPALGSLTMAAGTTSVTVTIAQTNSWGTVAVNTGTLAVGAFNVVFASFTVAATGTVTVDGISSSNYVFSADTGTISLTDWSIYNVGAGSSDTLRWMFNPSAAGAAVTMTINGLDAVARYNLFRDSVIVAVGETSAGGSVTFVITGGWSSHEMQVSPVASGGGPPEEPPAGPIPVPAGVDPALVVGAIIVALAGVGLVVYSVMFKRAPFVNSARRGGVVLVVVGALALFLIYALA